MTRPDSSAPARLPQVSRHRREGLWPFVLLILLSLGAAGALIHVLRERGRDLVQAEETGLLVLRRVESAQRRFHSRRQRYGWIEELDREGLLEGLDVVKELERWYITSGGYRIDVLLPYARLGPGVVGITAQGPEYLPDPALTPQHHAVVARPVEPIHTGYRTFYVDERGELYFMEGVTNEDDLLENGLPGVLVREEGCLDTSCQALWRRVGTGG